MTVSRAESGKVAPGAGTAALPGLLRDNLALLICPRCGGELGVNPLALSCQQCDTPFECEDGIPLLFWPEEADATREAVTERVKEFYEETPFPNYDDMDSRWTLRDKARRSVLGQLLDDQIKPGARVLEVGCGTGQMSNFLGLRPDRIVFGTDICLNSLRLAHRFARDNSIANVAFAQMNLFRPVFAPGTFDVVICNGVLHHTHDPLGGFRSISSLVKDDGMILIGLYNRFGRIMTNVRRRVFRMSGDRFTSLDPRLREGGLAEARRKAWFMDQYKHPQESQHTYGEVLRWFKQNGVTFRNSIPKCQPFKRMTAAENLFGAHSAGHAPGRFLVQLKMAFADREGGFYIFIGQKQPQHPTPR